MTASTLGWAQEWQRHLTGLASTNPHVLAVLALHAPTDTYPSGGARIWTECPGDDGGGYDREDPQWPCRTVETVAKAYLQRMMLRSCPTCTAYDVWLWPDGSPVEHWRLGSPDRGPCSASGRPIRYTPGEE